MCMKHRQEKVSIPKNFLHVIMFAEKVNCMLRYSHETSSASEDEWSSLPETITLVKHHKTAYFTTSPILMRSTSVTIPYQPHEHETSQP